MRVVLTSGEVFEAELEVPLGAPERPMSDEQLERKFRRLVEPHLRARSSKPPN